MAGLKTGPFVGVDAAELAERLTVQSVHASKIGKQSCVLAAGVHAPVAPPPSHPPFSGVCRHGTLSTPTPCLCSPPAGADGRVDQSVQDVPQPVPHHQWFRPV